MSDNWHREFESLSLCSGIQLGLYHCQRKNFFFQFLPAVSVGINSYTPFGIQFEWFFGYINFFIMSAVYWKTAHKRKWLEREREQKK